MRTRLYTTVVATWMIVLTPPRIEASECAYVTNPDAGKISVIDTQTDSVVATLSVPGLTGPVTVSGAKVYVALNNGVAQIDPSAGTVVDIPVPSPRDIAVTPSGSTVYVPGPNSVVSSIDASNHEATPLSLTGCRSDALSCDLSLAASVNPNGLYAYVYGRDTSVAPGCAIDELRPCDCDPLIETCCTSGDASCHAADVADSTKYLTRIDTRTNRAAPFLVDFGRVASCAICSRCPTALGRTQLATTPDGAQVYAVEGNGEPVRIFDSGLGSLLKRVDLVGQTTGMAMAADGTAFVTSVEPMFSSTGFCDSSVSYLTAIDRTTGNPTTFRLTVGQTLGAAAVAVTQDAKRAYVSMTFAGEFHVRTIACVGDCDQDGVVAISDLVSMVNTALGETDLDHYCKPGDRNGDGEVTVDEILTAVDSALTDDCIDILVPEYDAVAVVDTVNKDILRAIPVLAGLQGIAIGEMPSCLPQSTTSNAIPARSVLETLHDFGFRLVQ